MTNDPQTPSAGIHDWRPPGTASLAIAGPVPDTTRGVFWTFVGLHVLLWTLTPLATHPNRPLDMVEMLYWGQSWQWGYCKHPPLPAWIAQAIWQVSCGAVWPLYLAAQLGVAASIWAAWQLARRYLAPWPALCAALLLESCIYYNLATVDLNNSIVLQPLWALAVWWLYRALESGHSRYWLATGACLGLGMLCKYDMATLAVAMLVLGVSNRQARAAFRTAGPYLAVAVSLAIFAPHVAWSVANDFPTIRYVLSRSENPWSWLGHVVNPLEFVISQLIALLPIAVVLWPAWRARGQSAPAARPGAPADDSLRRDFLWLMCFGPLAFDLALSLALGSRLKSMWGVPMWTFVGLPVMRYAVGDVAPQVGRAIVRRAAWAGCVLIAVVSARNVVLPYAVLKPSRIHFPGAPLAQQVERLWRAQSSRPLSVVAGPWWPAANVALHSERPIEVYDFFYPSESPWSGDQALCEQGGIVLWEVDAEQPHWLQQLEQRMPQAVLLETLELNWQTQAAMPPARFRVAIVPPRRDAQPRPSVAGPRTAEAAVVDSPRWR